MSEPAPKNVDPQERLEALMADMNSRVSELTAQANDYEDRALLLRAEASALRTGVGGLEAAINRWHEEVARTKALQDERDHPGRHDPVAPAYPTTRF